MSENEDFKVHFISMNSNLANNILALAKENNYGVSKSLWSFACGYCFGCIK